MRAMKDSGIEWIGEIPTEWNTIKIKYIATLNGRIGWQGLTSAEYCDEGAYLITGINFENGSINWDTCVHVPMSRWEEASQIQVSEGDLLITKDGTVGKTAIVKNMPGETSLNSGVLLIKTKDYCNKSYLYWVLNSEIFWKWFNEINSGNSTIVHLYQYDFKEFSFPLPDLVVQQRIASYLDSKCSKIDSIVAKQQQLIEKLKEYRQAVITEAVTKGINPDVPMKDSGIEWIGEIPEDWSVCKQKYVMTFINGRAYKDEEFQEVGKYRVLRVGNLFTNPNWYYSDLELEETKYCDNGDLLYSWSMSYGPIIWNEDKVIYHYHIWKVGLTDKIYKKYAYYYLLALTDALKAELHETTMSFLTMGIMDNSYIAFGSKDTQKEIAAFLDDKCANIETSISRRQQLITKLQEYKKSLIYEVVTGKREVPNV